MGDAAGTGRRSVWQFGGRTFEVSESGTEDGRGGAIRLTDPAAPEGEPMLEVVRDDDEDLTFFARRTDGLPFDAVELFVTTARNRLAPAGGLPAPAARHSALTNTLIVVGTALSAVCLVVFLGAALQLPDDGWGYVGFGLAAALGLVLLVWARTRMVGLGLLLSPLVGYLMAIMLVAAIDPM